MLADGALTAPMLLEVYLQRIERLDSHLRAYRVVQFDRARAEAEAAQQRLDAGERLPLLGVPIAIKDDVDIAGVRQRRARSGRDVRRRGGSPAARGRRCHHRQNQRA